MLLNNTVPIIEELIANTGITGSQIAQKKNLNQKTVSNHLQQLEKETILTSTTQGKNKLYYFNTQNKEIVINYLLAIEHIRTIQFYQEQPLIKEISAQLQQEVKGTIILFGSYAKKTSKKDSDLDIMILGKCNEKKIRQLAKTYKQDIQLKIYPKFTPDNLTKEVIKNHIIISQGEQFIRGILHENY